MVVVPRKAPFYSHIDTCLQNEISSSVTHMTTDTNEILSAHAPPVACLNLAEILKAFPFAILLPDDWEETPFLISSWNFALLHILVKT